MHVSGFVLRVFCTPSARLQALRLARCANMAPNRPACKSPLKPRAHGCAQGAAILP
jgi:hypothetical protein